jgi:hypothetical protein
MFYHPDLKPSINTLSVETLAKGITLITAVSLAAGFLYDAIFFSVFQPFWGNLVLSDHIETAVFVVPFLTLAVAIQSGWTFWFFRSYIDSSPRNRWLYIAGAALLGGLFFGVPFAMVAGLSKVTAWVFIGAALFFAASAEATYKDAKGKRAVKPMFFLFLGVALLAVMAPVYAASRLLATYESLARRDFNAVVWGPDMTSMSGVLVRVIDRGIIMGVVTKSESFPYAIKFIFVPRDQIRRIEYGVFLDPV